MPLIRSIEQTADSVVITKSNGDVLILTAADIPGNVKNQSAAQVEAWVNNWISQQGWFAICKVRSIDPLDVNIVISQEPIPAGRSAWLS